MQSVAVVSLPNHQHDATTPALRLHSGMLCEEQLLGSCIHVAALFLQGSEMLVLHTDCIDDIERFAITNTNPTC